MARKEKKVQEVRPERPPSYTSRGSLNLHMKYLVISGKDEMKISRSVDGRVEDMSMAGLVFQTNGMRVDDLHLSYDESPVLRNKITMEIDLPGKRKVTVMGEVSWYERSFVARDQIYHVGVNFKEMSQDDREVLRQYLLAVKRAVEAIELDV
jgi:hypothetical protein